jgi:WhiB family redox-sensing transcriptional regulator
MTWRNRAACRGDDPRVFVPDSRTPDAYLAAKAICATCPVTGDCLDYAMTVEGSAAAPSRYGVYGGLSPEERYARYRRERRAAAEVTS